jgi:diacylglycerol kinase (ATP)
MPSENQPIHLIINPLSGYGGRKHQLATFRRSLAERGIVPIEHVTTGPREGQRYASRIASSASKVIVFGGDGTVNEVADGLAGAKVPLLIVPAGTENLLAKDLRLPSSPEKLTDVLLGGRVLRCDVGEVNGQTFHSILGVGFDAEVVRRVASQRTGHISHMAYFWPIWRTFWEHRYPPMRIEADGEEIFRGQGLAFVGNISRYSCGLRICLDAHSDDGLLDLVIFPCTHQVSLVLHSARTLLKRQHGRNPIIYRQGKRFRIVTQPEANCEIDGDVGPVSPLEVRLADYKHYLLAPAKD